MRTRPIRPLRVGVVAVVAISGLIGSAGLAGAAPSPEPGTVTPIAQGLAGPLQIDVGPSGTVYVAESFSGALRLIDRGGVVSPPLATNPTGEIGGVAARGNTIAYSTNDRVGPPPGEAVVSDLVVLKKGVVTLRVDLLAYEQTENPDLVNTYGFASISPECAAQLPEFIGPANYQGIIDSHPYALANADDGWYVAEAGGNAILHLSSAGEVTTVAVLPPQATVVTAEAAAGLGLPACTVGLTYSFEPVPTDVEVSGDGTLYVTTLPGGPEDPSLGARGAVHHVDPTTGTVELVAGGFLGAVNVAVGGGQVYVSELFANRVSVVTPDGPKVVAALSQPAGLEWARGRLYVSFDVFGNGSVGTIALH